jgi:hypothetical protein
MEEQSKGQDEELVLAVLQHLPLKEDFEEYKLVCKAFLTLSSAGH